MSCAGIANGSKYPKRKTTRKCSRCDNPIRKSKSTLCQKHYDEKEERREIKKENYAKNSMPPRSFYENIQLGRLSNLEKRTNLRAFTKSWFKNLKILPCANCGYDKHVELCHIKPVYTFSDDATIGEVNSKDNIIQLCRNCHWELDHNMITIEEIRSK